VGGHCTALHCTALHCTALHCTTGPITRHSGTHIAEMFRSGTEVHKWGLMGLQRLHFTALHCISQPCTAFQCLALHFSALHLLQRSSILALVRWPQYTTLTVQFTAEQGCAVCSVQCAVCSVQCAVCSVQCAVSTNPKHCANADPNCRDDKGWSVRPSARHKSPLAALLGEGDNPKKKRSSHNLVQ
jgi:hypothetical protein